MSFKRINQEQALALIADEFAVVVDIRDPVSYAAGHINQAVHLDNISVQNFIESSDREVPLIVCCYHGNSSQGAAEFFSQQGFSACFSLDGGYTAWQQAGLHQQ
jgi:thiosulfate sulfurtransferase